MKKSVVLTLIAVYILSICIVGFLGLKVKVLNPTIYSQEVKIVAIKNANTGEDYTAIIKANSEGLKSIRLSNPDKKVMRLTFVIDVTPDNTTNKEINVVFGTEKNCKVIQGSPKGGAPNQEIIIEFSGSSTVKFIAKDRSDEKYSAIITVSFKSY